MLRPKAQALLKLPMVVRKIDQLFDEESTDQIKANSQQKLMATIKPGEDWSKLRLPSKAAKPVKKQLKKSGIIRN